MMILTKEGLVLKGGNRWEGIADVQLVTWTMLEKALPGDSWEVFDPSNCARGTFSESLVVERIDENSITLVNTMESQNALNPESEVETCTRFFTYAKEVI